MKSKKGTVTSLHAGNQRLADVIAIRSNPDPVKRQLGVVRFVRTWIDSKRLQHEATLQELAWVEYRYMSPLARTELFSRHYVEAYRAAYAKALPGEDASKRRPIDPEFARNPADVMNALWESRASADAVGVPYDIYLETIIAGHFENDHWKRPPRPNQLYGKLTAPRLRDRPAPDEIGARLYGPDWDARFFAAAYVGDPVQEAAIAHLQADVLRAVAPAERLAEYLIRRRAITLDRAKSAFGPDLVHAAIAIGGDLPPVTVSGGGTGPFEPSCFGLPVPSKDSVCVGCPVNLACADHAMAAREQLIQMTGTDDPRAQRKRQLDAMRQRLHRERKRAPKDGESQLAANSGPGVAL